MAGALVSVVAWNVFRESTDGSTDESAVAIRDMQGVPANLGGIQTLSPLDRSHFKLSL